MDAIGPLISKSCQFSLNIREVQNEMESVTATYLQQSDNKNEWVNVSMKRADSRSMPAVGRVQINSNALDSFLAPSVKAECTQP